MLPSFCHLFGKLPFSVHGTLVLYNSTLELPKHFVSIAFYSQDFSLQLLQISFGSVTYGPNSNVEQFECSYAIILHTFLAQLLAIALFYFFLLQPLVFLLQLIIDFVSFLCTNAMPAASTYLATDINCQLLIRLCTINCELVIAIKLLKWEF